MYGQGFILSTHNGGQNWAAESGNNLIVNNNLIMSLAMGTRTAAGLHRLCRSRPVVCVNARTLWARRLLTGFVWSHVAVPTTY